jgi:hypothetical protein
MQSSGPCCQSDAILQARKPLFLHNDVYDVARHLLAAGWSRRADCEGVGTLRPPGLGGVGVVQRPPALLREQGATVGADVVE